ncbi:MAG: hypothetical protein SPG61_01275 [Arcanobacterium sp.]|nr:hypothetical protein [Arcanobacterium sp.]
MIQNREKIRSEILEDNKKSRLFSVSLERLLHRESGMITAELAINIPIFLTVALFCVSGILQATTATQVDTVARNAVRALSLGHSKHQVAGEVGEVLGKKAKLEITQESETFIVTVTLPGRGVFSWLGYNFAAQHRLISETG